MNVENSEAILLIPGIHMVNKKESHCCTRGVAR